MAASLRETEDSLARVPSTAKSNLQLLLLLLAKSRDLRLFPLMLQNCPRPYQAGPSHRLECKHTVAHGASVWALQDLTTFLRGHAGLKSKHKGGWSEIQAKIMFFKIYDSNTLDCTYWI